METSCADERSKCFTLIWKIENAEYCRKGYIHSPTFKIGETSWNFYVIFNSLSKYEPSYLSLKRVGDEGEDVVEIDCELAFLSSNGSILHSFEAKNERIGKWEWIKSNEFPSEHEVFHARRSVFISEDTLTVRCRIRRSEGDFSRSVQCLARTRLPVDKMSCMWYIRNFSSLTSSEKLNYDIKSLRDGENLMTLELNIEERLTVEILRLNVHHIYNKIDYFTLRLSIVDASKNTVCCLKVDSYDFRKGESVLDYMKRELIEKKKAYLPNDILSLLCELSYRVGNKVEYIEYDQSDCDSIKNLQPDSRLLDKTNVLPAAKDILIDDFKSLMNNDMFSDVKLKTTKKTYPAHKNVLGIRSPVFRAMFSSDMKEKNGGCVVIDDLSDETVFQMLRYIYSAEVELEWNGAMELYDAADKYEILHLKDLCSSYLKSNLSSTNACEALLLADLHQDANFKRFVQEFILRSGEDIIGSEEWDRLMETNLNLAAETMRLKFKV